MQVIAVVTLYDLYCWFDDETIARYTMVMLVITHRACTCDNVGTPGMVAETSQAQDSRSTIIPKLKTIAVKSPITVAILISSFMTNLSPHPDGMSVFYKKHCSTTRMMCEQDEVSRRYFASAKIMP